MLDVLKKIIRLISLNISKALNTKIILAIIAGLVFIKSYFSSPKASMIQITMTDFLSKLKSGAFTSAKVTPDSILALTKDKKVVEVSHSLLPNDILFNLLSKAKVNFSYSKPVSSSIETFFWAFLISATASFLYFFFFNKTSYKSGKSEKKVMFRDIIGLNQAKKSLFQVQQYMLSGEKYQNLGARMRRGILLHGPSGTGKTTLAKACAHESNVSFFSSNAAEFCEIYVGMGPKKIRDLFSKAKQSAPSIIYIDEIDAIGRRNNGGLFESSNSEKNSTINQLLSEMDGFDSSSQVLVIGSTNRLEMVDSALLRPGRFDLKIYTPLPNLKERIDIMKHHLKNKKCQLDSSFIQNIMRTTEGWSGAEIENLTNEAVYHSLRRKGDQIEQKDIISVLESSDPNFQNKKKLQERQLIQE